MAAVVPRDMFDLYEAEAPRDRAGAPAPRGRGEHGGVERSAGEDSGVARDTGDEGGDFVPDFVPDVDPALFRNALDAVTGGTKPIWAEGAEATLVDFWASWCPPCLAELPHLQELQERVEKRGMKVVLVNVDLENTQAVGRFLQRKGIHLDSLLDRDSVLFQALGLDALPSTFVLDARGRPVAFFQGGMGREELELVLLRANEKRVRNTYR